jgi:hypothetical protein
MLGAAFSVPAAVELLTREITELAEKSRLTINLDRDKLEEAVVEAAERGERDVVDAARQEMEVRDRSQDCLSDRCARRRQQRPRVSASRGPS